MKKLLLVDDERSFVESLALLIKRELSDEFYGDRVYMAKDPEGHVWTFSMTVRAVTRAEAEQTSGLKIESTVWK